MKLIHLILGFPLTQYLIPALVLFALLVKTAPAETMKKEGIFETATLECENLGGEALAIQAIRYELNNITVDEIVKGLDVLIHQEFPKEMQNQPLYLHRVRAVAKWVFYHFPPDFDEKLVGKTYEVECKKKTYASIDHAFPEILGEGSKGSQKRDAQKAWESGKDTEIDF